MASNLFACCSPTHPEPALKVVIKKDKRASLAFHPPSPRTSTFTFNPGPNNSTTSQPRKKGDSQAHKPKYTQDVSDSITGYSIGDSLQYYPHTTDGPNSPPWFKNRESSKRRSKDGVHAIRQPPNWRQREESPEVLHWMRRVERAIEEEHGGDASFAVDAALKLGADPGKIFAFFWKDGDKGWSQRWGGYWDDILERCSACHINPDMKIRPCGTFFHVLCRDHPLVVRYWLWRLAPCINIPDHKCRTVLDVFILKTTDWIANPEWFENFKALVDYGFGSPDIKGTFNRLISTLTTTRSYKKSIEKTLWEATCYLSDMFKKQKYYGELTMKVLVDEIGLPHLAAGYVLTYSFGVNPGGGPSAARSTKRRDQLDNPPPSDGGATFDAT